MRCAVLCAVLAAAALAGVPGVGALVPDAAAQGKDKEKDKDKDKDKEAEKKRKEEEEKKKREEERRRQVLENAIKKIAASFSAKSAVDVLANVSADAKVVLRLNETDRKGESSYSKDQARGVLDAFFARWKIITVDTKSMSIEDNVASFGLALRKDSSESDPQGRRLRIKVGSAEDKHPLVKLVVEW